MTVEDQVPLVVRVGHELDACGHGDMTDVDGAREIVGASLHLNRRVHILAVCAHGCLVAKYKVVSVVRAHAELDRGRL